MKEQLIGIFASPEDYAYHIGEVVAIGEHSLQIVRKQMSFTTPYRIELIPVSFISSVEYKSGLVLGRIITGIALLAAVFFYLGLYWSQLEPGTPVRIGLLALAVIYGLRWAFMSRRHQFLFKLQDGSRFKWSSRSGDYNYKTRVVDKVIEHFGELNLPFSKV